jgi:hypothetical protein
LFVKRVLVLVFLTSYYCSAGGSSLCMSLGPFTFYLVGRAFPTILQRIGYESNSVVLNLISHSAVVNVDGV